ncbi:MAG TPA: heparinase II/III family protein [Pyrinomonadaceae bacterium]|nr:heparinase II/III family protein [Pyrinomonadaceae bacterium]
MIIRCLFLLALFTGIALGQVTPRNLLSNRFKLEDIKRDLVSKNNWKPYPNTAAEWKSKVPQDVLDELVKKGEAALGKEIPPVPATLILEYVRTGNRSNYQENSFARRNRLMDLVLAEAIEDKGRFTDAIANYVWAICEETYWGVPAHLGVQKAKNGLPDADDPTVDLFGAETAATLALTDYLTGEKLDKVSPLLRKRIYTESYKKIFDPVKQTNRYNWLDPTKQVNNWNPWILSNLMEANLLLEPDEAKRAENLNFYMKLLDIYLNGLGEDGGCDEGPSYWFAAGGSVFDALEILQSATNDRINIYDEPLIGKMASYIYKMHIADNYFVDFADADPRFSGDGLMIYRFGKDIKDETLTEFGLFLYGRNGRATGEGFQKPRRLKNFLTIKDLPSSKSVYNPSPEAWFSDIQVLTARSSASGLFLAAHAGNNGESHNHNDVGDFIVYLGNEPVIIDTGRGNYTAKTFSSKRYELWFTQSNYHNLPIIDGFAQRDGKQFAAQKVNYSTNETESALTMDISKAYPKEAGIDFWNRSVKLNRAAETIAISDDYALAKAPNSLQQIFMTVCDVDLSEKGKIKLTTPSKKKITLTYDADWTPSVEKPSMEGAEYSSLTAKWNNRPIQRIVLTAAKPKVKDRLDYLVSIAK